MLENYGIRLDHESRRDGGIQYFFYHIAGTIAYYLGKISSGGLGSLATGTSPRPDWQRKLLHVLEG